MEDWTSLRDKKYFAAVTCRTNQIHAMITLYLRYSSVVYHSRKMGRKEMQEGVIQANMIITIAVRTVIREW